MRNGRADSRKRAVRGEPVILFVAAGHSFAISAAAVDEIRNTDALVPVPGRKVHSLLERGRNRHYVVDVATCFRLSADSARRVLVLRNSAVALAVDSVDRMTHMAVLYALPRAFTGDECRWYRGLALLNSVIVPVINPGAFLSKAEVAALEAALPPHATAVGAVSA